MSTTSTAYDALKARVVAVLSRTQSTDLLDIEETTESSLIEGYQIVVGSASNTNRLVGCRSSVARDFIVILTQKTYANELDITAKETAMKALFDAFELIRMDIEKDTTLGSSSIAKTDYVSDTGLEYVYDDKDNFYKVEITFNVEYFTSY
jgi:hypothetical protein